jgi:hypothetical protein
MRLAIEWARPVQLRKGRGGLIYTVDLDKIERDPGVYVFARRWGSSFEALYVGKSQNLRARIRGHLNNLRLMKHLETAKTGRRFVILGHPLTKPGQRLPKVLSVLEKALIRYFLSEGHDLVNQQGVRIRRHEIESSGRVPKAFMPSLMYLERSRGE